MSMDIAQQVLVSETNLLPVSIRLYGIAAGVGVVGAVTALFVFPETSFIWLPLGLAYGLVSTGVVGSRSMDPGRGLIWNLGFGVLTWCLFLATVRLLMQTIGWSTTLQINYFRILNVVLVCLAAPVGLSVGLGQLIEDSKQSEQENLEWTRAIVVGLLSGLLGGWGFSVWMEQVGLFPLIAGILGSEKASVGFFLHFLIAMFVGVTFGILFQRDVRRVGASVSWGMAYGIFWWFLGAMTLFPLLRGEAPTFDSEALSAGVGTFMGHVIYGIILGFVHSTVDGSWRLLFHRSDPLNQEFSGPGVRSFIALYRSWFPSLVGSLAFGYIMWQTGVLPRVAQLIGYSSPVIGFLVHMIIGSIIGMTYGIAFRYESFDLASGASWGMVYGVIWWFLGPLTLFPYLLGESLAWTAGAIKSSFLSLLGHLMYGVITGIGFYFLERESQAWVDLDERIARHEAKHRRPVGTPAPALWFFVLSMGMTLPIVLA